MFCQVAQSLPKSQIPSTESRIPCRLLPFLQSREGPQYRFKMTAVEMHRHIIQSPRSRRQSQHEPIHLLRHQFVHTGHRVQRVKVKILSRIGANCARGRIVAGFSRRRSGDAKAGWGRVHRLELYGCRKHGKVSRDEQRKVSEEGQQRQRDRHSPAVPNRNRTPSRLSQPLASSELP